jgi:hypothetical protein
MDRENTIVFYDIIEKLLVEVEAIYTHFTGLPIGDIGNPSQFTIITIMESISYPELTGLVCIGGVVLKHSNFDKLTEFLQTYLLKLELINVRFDRMDITEGDIEAAYKKVKIIVDNLSKEIQGSPQSRLQKPRIYTDLSWLKPHQVHKEVRGK